MSRFNTSSSSDDSISSEAKSASFTVRFGLVTIRFNKRRTSSIRLAVSSSKALSAKMV